MSFRKRQVYDYGLYVLVEQVLPPTSRAAVPSPRLLLFNGRWREDEVANAAQRDDMRSLAGMNGMLWTGC